MKRSRNRKELVRAQAVKIINELLDSLAKDGGTPWPDIVERGLSDFAKELREANKANGDCRGATNKHRR